MSNMIFKKMSDVMKDVKAVTKDQKNVQQGFKFRGIDQFVNALYPALTKHGVFMTPRATSFTHEIKEVTRSSGKIGVDKHVAIMMEYDFFAEDGSKVTVGPVPAEGVDSGDKATNKALSAALKYALIQTFTVPTEDMEEADRESPELGIANKASLNNTVKAQPLKLEQPKAEPAPAQAAPVAEPPKAEAPKRSSFKKPAPVATPAVITTTTTASDDGWE